MNDIRKFKRKKYQSNPTNPTGNTQIENNTFDLENSTIREKQNKQ